MNANNRLSSQPVNRLPTPATPSSAAQVRWDRVRAARRAIARGKLETPRAWRVVVDRLARVL